MELVTFGETMALLASVEPIPLRHTHELRLGHGGAESNTAIGLARLGHEVAWLGRVGDDEFGAMVLASLRGERVDTARATVDSDAPTGLMVRGRDTQGRTQVFYYRTASAGSRLSPEDLDATLISDARVLYITGITPALGAGPKSAVMSALEIARASGVRVAFDPNYRSKLWNIDEARPVFEEILAMTDVVLAGLDELQSVFGASEIGGAATVLADMGPNEVVIREGAKGATAFSDGEQFFEPAIPADLVDPVGAGDAFNAGYLSGLLRGEPIAARLKRGVTTASHVISARGDWEGSPFEGDVDRPEGEVVR